MADIVYNNTNSPTSRTEVTFNSWRDGATVYIRAVVSVTLVYSSGYFNYDGEINFNMWTGVSSTSANIKGYSDRWTKGSPRTRTRECTMSFTSTGNSIQVGCNVTVPSGHVSIAMPDQYLWIDFPSFNPPSTPTWSNINPNPCGINARPLITWGGASAGSLGRLYYDVEVRSTRESGGWTDWLRISSAQVNTSYQEIVISGMNVYNQKPYVGVKYQYRIRSSDGSYATSGWINTPELSISFGSPTPPTTYTFSDKSIKKDGSIIITWSGATGGTGNISGYYLEYKIYNHKTSTWTNWTQIYAGATSSYTFSLPSVYPNATNGDLVQFRIRVKNSWNQYSTYLTTASLSVRGNQMWIKINGAWVEGDTYLKVNGAWVEATPYIKVNGVWYETT